MIKSALIIMVLVLIINFSIFVSTHQITYSQNSQNNNSGNIYSWVSKRDNLNITMQFEPKNPVIYYQTKILFKINNLNGSEYVKNITAIVTILDSEGGLYKFGKQKVIDGKTFINYIFPNSGKNKIILQLYENNSGLALVPLMFNCAILLLLQMIIILVISFQIYLKIFLNKHGKYPKLK